MGLAISAALLWSWYLSQELSWLGRGLEAAGPRFAGLGPGVLQKADLAASDRLERYLGRLFGLKILLSLGVLAYVARLIEWGLLALAATLLLLAACFALAWWRCIACRSRSALASIGSVFAVAAAPMVVLAAVGGYFIVQPVLFAPIHGGCF